MSGCVASIRCSQLVPLRWAPTRKTMRSRSGESARTSSDLGCRDERGPKVSEATHEWASGHVEGDGRGPSYLHTPVVVDVTVQRHACGVAAGRESCGEPHLEGLRATGTQRRGPVSPARVAVEADVTGPPPHEKPPKRTLGVSVWPKRCGGA